ncbi:hypothetical protein ACFQL1_18265 [Halomicroarcula sp. GCM10025709]|uniref:hypothetical protein n=1 Tax=Haloarcula TaxID=2237 RepID=UPI0024C300A6|nr:hypothetical protein [Halomicroarcula sp. YJ-61-S]
MRWPLVAVLCLVLLTGCSGLSGLDGGDRSATTPAPVPTVTERASTPSAPPGLDADGLAGVGYLSNGHERALENRSYTFRERYTMTTTRDTGRLRVTRNETTAVVDGRNYRHDLERTRILPNRTVERYEQSMYGDGRVWFERRDDGTVDYYRGDLQFYQDEFAGEAAFYVDQYVSANRSWTQRVRRNGSLYYRLVGVGGTPPGISQAESYRVRLLVAPDGLVRQLSVRYTTTIGSQTETVSYRFWYEDVDSTTAPSPDWLDEARQRTGNRSDGSNR